MLEKQTIHFPLALGVDTKTHPFAVDMPKLAIAENLWFIEPGSLVKRPGHATLPLTVSPAAGAPVQMTALTSGFDESDTSSYVTASFTPHGNKLVLAVVVTTDDDLTAPAPTMTGNGLTWVSIASQQFYSFSDENGDHAGRLTLFRAMVASPTTGAATISLGGDTHTGCAWSICEFSGVDTGGTNGSAAVVQFDIEDVDNTTSIVHTLSAFGSSANVTYQCGAIRGDDDLQTEFGWTQIHEINTDVSSSLLSQWLPANDTSPSMVCGFARDMVGIAIEIKAAAAGGAAAPVSNIRGLAVRDPGREEELVAFADEKVYVWSGTVGQWQNRGNYVGCELALQTVSNTNTKQKNPDRARYGNYVIYAWEETNIAGNTDVQFQIFDTKSNTPLTAITSVGSSGNTENPQCIAIGTSLQLWYKDTDLLKVKVISTTDIPGTIGTAAITFVDTNQPNFCYDVINKTSSQAIVVYQKDNASADNYEIAFANEAGASSSVTLKALVSTEDSPISLAYTASLDRVAVIRVDGGGTPTIRGDILNGSTFATVSSGTGILAGVTVANISAISLAFRTTAEADATYRAVVFWDNLTGGNRVIEAKYFGTDAAIGTVAPLGSAPQWRLNHRLVTKAFSRNGKVYVGTVTTPSNTLATQSHMIVYREDWLIIAHPVEVISEATVASSHLRPHIQDLTSDAFATIVAYHTTGVTTAALTGTALKSIVMDFNSYKPYRAVPMGKSLYMQGGYCAVFDGQRVVEQGFFRAVDNVTFATNPVSSGMTGGVYTYRVYPCWWNSQGELVRGPWLRTFSTTDHITGDNVVLTIPSVIETMKLDNIGERGYVFFEVYRAERDLSEVFYRVNSNDQSATGNNGFVWNNPAALTVTFTDVLIDTDLVQRPADPANGQIPDSRYLPSGSVIAQGQGRVFCTGHEQSNLVTFSKLWDVDTQVVTADGWEMVVPQDGGPVTAIHPADAGVYIFKLNRIYFATGGGPSNLGTDFYGDPQLVTADTGCTDQRTIVQVPTGIMFMSPKGWKILEGTQLRDVGYNVKDYNTQDWTAAILLPDEHSVLCCASGGKALLYDYLLDQWATWTQPLGIALVPWTGNVNYGYAFTTGSAISYRPSAAGSVYTDLGSSYTMDIETPWIKTGGLQGFGRIWRVSILGEWQGNHNLRIRMKFEDVDTTVDDQTWTVDSTRYNVRVCPSRQKVKSFKVRLTDVSNGAALLNTFKAVGLSIDVGTKSGVTRQPTTRSM